jgi:uncharacterized repeat protein (TIGR03809 family)
MTQQLDLAGGRDVVARWCTLAEQRLEYLTELFKTGRWRRFHSERAFLENIQEAKAAVEAWRNLSSPDASRNSRPIDTPWRSRSIARGEIWRDPVHLPRVAEIAEAGPPEPAVIAKIDSAPVDDTPAVPLSYDNRVHLTQQLMTTAERYPLLRNRL